MFIFAGKTASAKILSSMPVLRRYLGSSNKNAKTNSIAPVSQTICKAYGNGVILTNSESWVK